jgi:hypothetical protein
MHSFIRPYPFIALHITQTYLTRNYYLLHNYDILCLLSFVHSLRSGCYYDVFFTMYNLLMYTIHECDVCHLFVHLSIVVGKGV